MPFAEADFADPDAPARVVQAAHDALGPLEILVANHARSGHGRLGELTAAHIDDFLHENVRASLLLAKEFAAQFTGNSGRVILMTSGQHLGPMSREVAYAVSKGAIQQATMTLAEELARPRHHRQHGQPRPDRHGLGARQLGSHGGDALRPLGRA